MKNINEKQKNGLEMIAEPNKIIMRTEDYGAVKDILANHIEILNNTLAVRDLSRTIGVLYWKINRPSIGKIDERIAFLFQNKPHSIIPPFEELVDHYLKSEGYEEHMKLCGEDTPTRLVIDRLKEILPVDGTVTLQVEHKGDENKYFSVLLETKIRGGTVSTPEGYGFMQIYRYNQSESIPKQLGLQETQFIKAMTSKIV